MNFTLPSAGDVDVAFCPVDAGATVSVVTVLAAVCAVAALPFTVTLTGAKPYLLSEELTV